MSRRQAVLFGGVGLSALAMALGARYAYGDFLPMRGYTPLHAHILAPQEGLFLALFTLLGGIAALGLGACATGLLPWSLSDWLATLSRRLSDRLWMLLLATLAATASVMVTHLVLEGAFLTDDEMAMLFQARLLTEGRLWAEPTPFPGPLSYAMMVESPRWYGIYPVGHPALLALSILLSGDAHTIVAAVAAGWVILTFLLGRRLFGRRVGLLGAAMMTASPFFLLSSGSLAAQMTSGLFLLGAANAAIRLDGKRPWLMSAALGVFLGLAFLARPYTTLAVAFPLAVLGVRLWLRKRTALFSPLIVILSGAPFAALYLWTNAAVTGSAWLTPYEAHFTGPFHLGFGQDAFGVVHSPQLALGVAALVLLQLNAWSLGWPVSLLPFGCGLTLKKPKGRILSIAFIPLSVLLAYMVFPLSGVSDTGPLYYLEVLPIVVVLSARGLSLLSRRLAGVAKGRGRELVAWVAIAATAVGGVLFFRQQVDVLRDLAAFNEEPYALADRIIDGRAVVFVEDIQSSPQSSWVLGNRPPYPDLRDRIIYSNAPTTQEALELMRWSGRRGYYMSRDRRSGEVSLVPVPAPPP